MSNSLHDRVIALAAITQASQCVQQIAQTGMTDSNAFSTCIESIFAIDANTTDDVYAGAQNLLPGLKLLAALFENKRTPNTLEVMRYIFGAINLERRLNKKPSMQAQLSSGIEQAKIQANHYSTSHKNVLANLADIYSNTLSTLTPRIMVNGEQIHLDNNDNVYRIRALLLSSIRGAVLWRQKKGTRLQLFFQRKAYLVEIKRLIKETNN